MGNYTVLSNKKCSTPENRWSPLRRENICHSCGYYVTGLSPPQFCPRCGRKEERPSYGLVGDTWRVGLTDKDVDAFKRGGYISFGGKSVRKLEWDYEDTTVKKPNKPARTKFVCLSGGCYVDAVGIENPYCEQHQKAPGPLYDNHWGPCPKCGAKGSAGDLHVHLRNCKGVNYQKGGIMSNVKRKLKNLVKSEDQRLLEKYDVTDECGDVTEMGIDVVVQAILDDKSNPVRQAIVESLKKLDSEENKKK